MICPQCAAQVGLQSESCPSCAVGLREYAVAAYLPHWLVNEALTRLRREQWSEAATFLAQAALFLPRDTDVLRGWAHALAQMGDLDLALEKIMEAREISGTDQVDEEYTEILALIEEKTRYAGRDRRVSGRPAYLASRRNWKMNAISCRNFNELRFADCGNGPGLDRDSTPDPGLDRTSPERIGS